MFDVYRQIQTENEVIFKEKASKFIAKSFVVESPEDAEHIVKQLRKDYHDARHWCYAYQIGKDYSIERQCDDGEPSGTAGKPILGQLKSFNLTNVLVVVIRYFGGTLLGTGGLIKAYKTSTQMVLEESGVEELEITQTLKIQYKFSQTRLVNQLMKKHGLKPSAQNFTEICEMEFEIKQSEYENYKNLFTKNLIITR